MFRFVLPVLLVAMLTACSSNQGNNGGSATFPSTAGLFSGLGGSGQVDRPIPQTLDGCLAGSSARMMGVPSLMSRAISKPRRPGGLLELSVEDILAYSSMVVGVSGGDTIAAAELISAHEAADTDCFARQANFVRGNGSPNGAQSAALYSQATGLLGRAYSTLKTYTASGGAGDLSERLRRSYVPVTLRLPVG